MSLTIIASESLKAIQLEKRFTNSKYSKYIKDLLRRIEFTTFNDCRVLDNSSPLSNKYSLVSIPPVLVEYFVENEFSKDNAILDEKMAEIHDSDMLYSINELNLLSQSILSMFDKHELFDSQDLDFLEPLQGSKSHKKLANFLTESQELFDSFISTWNVVTQDNNDLHGSISKQLSELGKQYYQVFYGYNVFIKKLFNENAELDARRLEFARQVNHEDMKFYQDGEKMWTAKELYDAKLDAEFKCNIANSKGSALLTKIAKLEAQIEELTGEKEQFEKSCKSLKKVNKDLVENIKEQSESFNIKLDEATQQIEHLESNNRVLEIKLNDKISRISELNSNITNLESNVANLETDISSIRDQLKVKDQEIETLTNALDSRSVENEKLERAVITQKLVIDQQKTVTKQFEKTLSEKEQMISKLSDSFEVSEDSITIDEFLDICNSNEKTEEQINIDNMVHLADDIIAEIKELFVLPKPSKYLTDPTLENKDEMITSTAINLIEKKTLQWVKDRKKRKQTTNVNFTEYNSKIFQFVNANEFDMKYDIKKRNTRWANSVKSKYPDIELVSEDDLKMESVDNMFQVATGRNKRDNRCISINDIIIEEPIVVPEPKRIFKTSEEARCATLYFSSDDTEDESYSNEESDSKIPVISCKPFQRLHSSQATDDMGQTPVIYGPEDKKRFPKLYSTEESESKTSGDDEFTRRRSERLVRGDDEFTRRRSESCTYETTEDEPISEKKIDSKSYQIKNSNLKSQFNKESEDLSAGRSPIAAGSVKSQIY